MSNERAKVMVQMLGEVEDISLFMDLLDHDEAYFERVGMKNNNFDFKETIMLK